MSSLVPSPPRAGSARSTRSGGQYGYSPPSPPQLTPEQHRALRAKNYQQRLQEISEKFESADEQLDSLRYQYTSLVKESETLKQRIVEESESAEQLARELKDPMKATKDALATSQRTIRLIDRLRREDKPRMYIEKKPAVFDSSFSLGTPRPVSARTRPRKGFVASAEDRRMAENPAKAMADRATAMSSQAAGRRSKTPRGQRPRRVFR